MSAIDSGLRITSDLHSFLENLPLGVFRTGEDGTIIYANPAFVKILSFPDRETLLAAKAGDLYADPSERPGYLKSLQSEGVIERKEIRLKRYDGTPVWVEFNSIVVRDENGQVLYYQGSVQDITERKQFEASLRASEERFRRAFEESPIGMALVGDDFRFLKVNHALAAMLGYSANELVSRKFVEITHPEDIEKDVKLAENLFRGEIPSYRIEKRYITRDGNILWINLTATVLRDAHGRLLYALAMIENIHDRKLAESQLEYMANHDSLTGHFNRHYFDSRSSKWLAQAMRYKYEFTFVLFDVDGLSRVNDEHGHLAGDVLLKDVSTVLRKCVRESDEVIRWGGDEFLVYLPHTSTEEAGAMVSRVKAAGAAPDSSSTPGVSIDLSAGIYTWKPGASIEEMLREADQSMYQEKRKKHKNGD